MADDPRMRGAPDDWHEAVDPESGHTYFYNDLTGESSWEKPVGYADRRHSVGRVRHPSVAEKRTLSMSPRDVGKKILSTTEAAASLSAWAEGGGGGGEIPSSSSDGVLLGQSGGKAATDRAEEESYTQMGNDGEERRHAPDGGGLYTQAEFAAFFDGSLVQWNVATSPTPAEVAAAKDVSGTGNVAMDQGEDKDMFRSGGHNRDGARYRSNATQRGEEEKREDAVRGHHVTATVRGKVGRRTGRKGRWGGRA
jgi:hypothetical protein